MTDRSFTPGPWSLSTVATSSGSCHKIGPFPSAGYRPEAYACVYVDGARIGIDEALPAAQELLANAHLIAAAPDMFGVLLCEEALDAPQDEGWPVLERYGWDSSSRFDLSSTEFVRRLRRAALAKARGEVK